MKKLYSFFLLLSLLGPGWLLPYRARAQSDGTAQALPEFTNCFPKPLNGRPAGSSAGGARAQSASSTYGNAVTPQGTLKILVVFAGFTNDIDTRAPFYYDPTGTNPWPQEDATHPAGTTFPKNANQDFYSSTNSFPAPGTISTATDRTLSNLYYQMSQHSPNPFKMQAVFFPKRINVTATAAMNKISGFFQYTDDVMNALKNDPDTRNFDFSQVDKRAGTPGFSSDNSGLASDNVIDYTVIIWRNTGSVFGIHPDSAQAYGGTSAWAGVPGTTAIPSADGKLYSLGAGFSQAYGMSGLSQDVFLHEFAHTLYLSPHYLAANRSEGSYFYISGGPGMMGGFVTHTFANAWERWYNGWIELQTGATHVSSDIQSPASLTATNGEYTLRDYVTTGDAIRIKLPNSTQHLWLENHQFKSALDGRANYHVGARTPPNPLRSEPTGIIAIVEDVADSRTKFLFSTYDGCNGMKVLSAQGSFDYTKGANLGNYNNYFYHNGTLNDDFYDFTNPVANPFGGETQLTRRRIDLNNNNVILTNQHDGNVAYNTPEEVTESAKSFILNGAGEDGMFGPDAAFNTVGQKLGNSYNPAIFEQQHYDLTTAKLTPIRLGALSVELIAKDPTTGAITVKVRYDDADIVQNTRWTGELLVQKNFDLAAGKPEVHVTNQAGLLINKSGTNNRHTKTAANDFINPTSLICDNATNFVVDNGGQVRVEGDKTTFRVRAGATLSIAANSSFIVGAGAALILESGSTCSIAQGGTIQVQAGGTLIMRYQATVSGQGSLAIANGGYLCVGTGAVLSTAPNFVFYVSPTAIMGANPTLGNQGFSSLTCNGQLQFCGQMSGGNTNISVICPTGNEALLFDGTDDVVTIPVPQNMPAGASSPIHNIGDTFTIEATIRSDASGGPNQTIFSNRQYAPAYGTRGLLFTLYAGQYLLLQINGLNYYDLNDPLMALAPNSGCHQVAVTRDDNYRVRFYIDGVPANYSPTVYDSPYSTAAVRFGGDAPYSNQSFNGQIGEVRYWDYFRTDAEILRYLSAQIGGPNTEYDLKGYYDMRDASGQFVADKALVYNSSWPYVSPTGFLGTTNGPEASDPTWVAAANLTCNLNGNFRSAARPAPADTTGQSRKLGLPAAGVARGQRLSSLTLSPNPASGEATLHFQLREAGPVEVTIQDMTGLTRAVALPPAQVAAGTHDVRLPLQKLRPGLYLVLITSADGRQVIRLEVK